MKLTGLCLVVTDPVASYETVAEAAVKAGLGYLQLRMKRAPRAEILATAKRLRAITRGTDTCFIVNDDPALAAEAEADGVHLGQGDLPLPEARAAFPGLRLFGLSTHSFAQMRAAEAVSPDYIGVGPLYAPRPSPTPPSAPTRPAASSAPPPGPPSPSAASTRPASPPSPPPAPPPSPSSAPSAATPRPTTPSAASKTAGPPSTDRPPHRPRAATHKQDASPPAKGLGKRPFFFAP